jgi:hypothetical protein
MGEPPSQKKVRWHAIRLCPRLLPRTRTSGESSATSIPAPSLWVPQLAAPSCQLERSFCYSILRATADSRLAIRRCDQAPRALENGRANRPRAPPLRAAWLDGTVQRSPDENNSERSMKRRASLVCAAISDEGSLIELRVVPSRAGASDEMGRPHHARQRCTRRLTRRATPLRLQPPREFVAARSVFSARFSILRSRVLRQNKNRSVRFRCRHAPRF